LAAALMDMINASCHRRIILHWLGELNLIPSLRTLVPKEICCSACNPNLFEPFDDPQPVAAPPKGPTKGSYAHDALVLLSGWCVREIEYLFKSEFREYSLPPDVFMEPHIRVELAGTIKSNQLNVWANVKSKEEMLRLCPSLDDWEHIDNRWRPLLNEL
jgi:hypothetical protein